MSKQRKTKMDFELDAMCIGELIRFNDKLRKSVRINKKEYDAITKFLAFIINEEEY